MKKKNTLFFLCLLAGSISQAQTWNGSAGTNWNTPANWTPNTIPIATGAVTIPNTANKPVLASNVTIASFNMAAGSALNFNGFTLSITGATDIVGATLSNSNGATDIVINFNSAGGAGANYMGSTTISDNVTLNYNGTGTSYEGYSSGNIFTANSIFNLAGTGRLYSSYSQKSSFSGNLTVNRTVAGITDLFNAGFNFITGNFSYTNNAGGDNYINSGSVLSGPIGGTVNITVAGSGNPSFQMKKIKNLTTGGNISVQNSGYTLIQNDTLTVNAMNISGFTGSNSDEMTANVITGNVTFAEDVTNAGSVYVGTNTINGNTTLATNFTATWYEGYAVGNIYNGNTTFTLNGTGTFNSSYSQKCSFGGNLTVTRTGVGITNLLENGFNFITGNFSYTNATGGNTFINGNNVLSGPINGTVNITATGTGNPSFYLFKIKNLTSGGTISVQNSGYTLIRNDTLAVTTMNVNGFTGANSDEMSGCVISGNVTFAEAATNTGSVYVGTNIINGNTTLGTNFTATWYEGYSAGDIYNGNTTFNLNGTGTFNSSYSQKCSFAGNLTVTRTGAGTTNLLENGFNFITGNFSYTNAVGGNTFINGNNVLSGPINGTVNITATGSGNPSFYLYKIKNLTNGGTISVQNSGYTLIRNDTLAITALNVNDFTGANSDEITGCGITGNVTFSEAASNTGSVYVGNNTINGNSIITSNAPTTWYESYSSSDTYNGDVSFIRNGAGTFNIAYSDTLYANRGFILNSTAGIDINTAIEFGGSNNGIVEQLGTQPIITPRLIMRKTGNGFITLNDSLTVSSAAGFVSGHIKTSIGKELIFPASVTYTGASETSHVIGPVIKVGSQAFIFPVGTAVSLNTVAMSAPVGAASRFRAAYINQNPGSNGYNTALKAGSFGAAAISKAGYWDVERLTGVTNVTLTLGFGTNPYEQYPASLANLKVAHWNGAQWDDHGNGSPTGTVASGTITNSVPITSFSPFTLAGVTSTYFYTYANPGPGPDGTPVKFGGLGGYPAYSTKQLPGGSYSLDSIFLIPNAATVSFKGKDSYDVERDDTTVTAPTAPTVYVSANGNGTVNFKGWRHFVYMKTVGNQIIGAIRDNNLTLGNTTMTAYFSTPNVATAPNGNIYLKRSFKITSQFAPVGTTRVRFYILKTEFNNLQAADPTSFPNGINSLTITKYTGPQEDSLFNPIPGGNAVVIPNSDITIVDMGTMYSLDIDVTGFSGFYIGGNQANVSLCAGSTIAIPSNVTGTTYQWQVNTGSGFTNISNGAVYGGATTKTLTLTNTPSSYYGYQYRAFVNGSTYSQVYTVKFTATWQGTLSNVWENAANWNCGILPDVNTDVLINPGKANYPQLGANTSVRTLKAAAGTSVIVKTGFNLTIAK